MSYQADKSRHFDQFSSDSHPLLGSGDGMNGFQTSDELEIPLDAFDKQLLSEVPQDRQQQASQGLTRISLPPRHQNISDSSNIRQTIRDDLYQTPMRSGSSSTTIVEHPSSPTVSALQNRRSYGQRSRDHIQQDTVYAQQSNHWDQRALNHTQVPSNTSLALGHGPPVVRGVRLVPISDLPDQLSSIFPHKLLNVMQSKCFPAAFHTDDNLVLSAPTGSGKTLVMELAICRLLNQNRNADFKVVYQAPTKALCAERYRDWNTKFGTLGLECAELTGDTEYGHLRQVQSARIIITTPEKWDSVTRKWKDQMKLMQLIKLFLVDEVHIVRESRGATLEAVVSRMKSIGTNVRFVALSATVPNSEDIATWLGKDRMNPDLPAQREVFDESYRPVKLEKHVYGFKANSNDFISDKVFMNQVPSMIAKHSNGKPTMIFCMTRKSAATTASNLAVLFNQSPDGQKLWAKPAKSIVVRDNDLKALVASGVAFHHAGVGSDDRLAVEQGFLRGDISIICSTSTLAVGINLPCYLVILQGTMSYGDTGAQEYPDLEVMQMVGRAGRPQFDRSACAVILTREERVTKYQQMVSGQQLLESTLHRNLIEHLNAEIGLGTISDIASAKRWLSSTFLSVRLGRNPGYYHLDGEGAYQSQDQLLQQICEKDVNLLVNHDCVEQKERLRSTETGDAMARYYVKFETIKVFTGVPPKAKMSEILSILSQATEFNEVRFKSGEKSYYKELNKETGIRFPVNVDIALTAHKISILLQAELGGVDNPVSDAFKKLYNQHTTDRNVVFGHAKRLIRCIIDCQLQLKDAVSVRNALELGRSITARAWDNTPQQLREIPGIGLVYARKLAAGGIGTIESFINTEPERIDLVVGKPQPFGRNLLKKMADFPGLRIGVKEMSRDIQVSQGAMLKMKAEVGFINERVPISFRGNSVSVIFVAEDSEGTLWDFRRFSARKIQNGDDFRFTVNLTKPAQYIRCSIMCDEIVGTLRYADAAVLDLPIATFPKSITATQQTHSAKTIFSEIRSPHISEETFGDGGIDDRDLLAAGAKDGDVEVIQDIDQYHMETIEENTKTKRHKSKHTEKQSAQKDDDYREPVQLDNGRWTCQHSCKDEGVECKHKCCIEGVANPRKRPCFPPNMRSEEAGQQKITSMSTNIRKPSSIEHKHVLDLDSLHESATKDSGLSFEAARPLSRAHERPMKRQRLSPRNDVAPRASQGLGEHSRREDAPTSRVEQGLPSTTPYDFDEELNLWNADDCDWDGVNVAPDLLDDLSWRDPERTAADSSRIVGLDIEPASNAKLRDNEPPVPFLSLADLEKPRDQSLFITGQSSSPVKQTRPTEDGGRTAHDAKAFESAIGGPDDLAKADWEVFNGGDPDFHQNLPYVPVSRQPLKVIPENAVGRWKSRGTKDLNAPATETTQEKERRLWEEDQKQKWEGIDPWMYERFHDIVELI